MFGTRTHAARRATEVEYDSLDIVLFGILVPSVLALIVFCITVVEGW